MLHIPTTPTSTHSAFRLPSSSPLQFEPPSSPLAGPSASARRASQYKSRTSARRTLFPAGGDQTTPTAPRASVFEGGRRSEPAQSTLLRERFRVRCEERAARARAEGVRRSRYASSEAGSSDVDMAEDDDEDEEAFMADELYRRIMANKFNREAHNYRLSYQQEVGSSLDPDMEDVTRWEQEAYDEMGDLSVDVTSLDDDDLAVYAEQMQDGEDWEALADQIFAVDDDELGGPSAQAKPSLGDVHMTS